MKPKSNKLASRSAKKLPSYERPPVTEVVCGVRFNPSQNFTLPHCGLLWDKFRKEYPKVEHAAPLVSIPGELLVDSVTGAPLPRVWFINQKGNQLIQFQPDRIYFNWRQRGDVYPRYENVIRNFEGVLDVLRNFFEEFQLGEFSPVECELTYINHIQKEADQETVKELQRFFKDFFWNESPRFLPKPIDVAWNLQFALPDQKGRLITSLKQAKRMEGNVPIVVLEFTARGIGQAKDQNGIRDWFDTAHVWIVRGFSDITTDAVQTKVWGRKHV